MQRAGAVAGALGEDHHGLAPLQQRQGRGHRFLIGLAALDREGAEAVQDPAGDPAFEQLALGHEVDRLLDAAADHERVQEAAVVGGQDHGPLGGHVLAAGAAHAQEQQQEGLEHHADGPVHPRVHAALADAAVVQRQLLVPHSGHVVLYPDSRGRYAAAMVDFKRALNGALAGTVAAATWAAQQSADKRAFESGYDDVELLGKAVTRGDGWPAAGLAIHLANGAAFGATYSALRPFLPGPLVGRAVTMALIEHVALWPLVRWSTSSTPRARNSPADRQRARLRPGRLAPSGVRPGPR